MTLFYTFYSIITFCFTKILLTSIQSTDKDIFIYKEKNTYIVSKEAEVCQIHYDNKGITLTFLKPNNFFNDKKNFLTQNTFYAANEIVYYYEGTLKYYNELDYVLDLIKQASITK